MPFIFPFLAGSLLLSVEDTQSLRVLSVNSEQSTLQVELSDQENAKRENLPIGPFEVSVIRGDSQNGYIGQTIEGRLFQSMGQWRLETIWPAKGVAAALFEEKNRQLRRETARMRRRDFRSIGDYLPPFALYNHEGQIVTNDDLTGKPFVINFIFTRCQVDRMCPASSRRMVELQGMLEEAGFTSARLVTLSFDSAFDTPGVLRDYALQYGMDLDRFQLLTGPQVVINDLLMQFGIITVEEDGTIDHTMATLLVDESGRIVHRREGSSWRSDDFLNRLSQMASAR